MILALPLIFGALGVAVGAVAAAFTTHAAGEKDRQAAKYHRTVANELSEKYVNLENKYYELADESKKQINDLTRKLTIAEVEKDCLRLAIRLQQNVIFLMWEIDRNPTQDALNRFQVAVEQTNKVLEQLEEELIIVPDDYYKRLLTVTEANEKRKVKKIDKGYESPKSITTHLLNAHAILAIDLGRTSTKTCMSREPGTVAFIPANVKQMSIEEVHGGVFEATTTEHLMDLWLEYQDNYYAVGQLAADFGANLGIGQSKVEDALVKVLACAGYFKVRDEVSVVLGLSFLSMEQFEEEKAQLITLITGYHVFKFRGNSISLNVIKVLVMPEGYGSLIWMEARPNTGVILPDFSKMSVGIVDIGHQTIDFIVVDNFRFARGASKSEDFGMSKFYEMVAKEIDGCDSKSLALISAVNKPKGERFYRPKGASKLTNLDNFLPNFTEHFSREICSRVLAWLPERVTDVIITGGGGEFFWEDVQRLLKEAKISTYLSDHCRQANALGQYI